jgi:hypothetical protein
MFMSSTPAMAARSESRSPNNAPDRIGKTSARNDTYRGRFVKLVPNEQVVEKGESDTTDLDLRGEMTITITLIDADGGTHLNAIREGLPPGVSAANELGWQQSSLNSQRTSRRNDAAALAANSATIGPTYARALACPTNP